MCANTKGCEYGRLLKKDVTAINNSLQEFENNIINRLDKFETKSEIMFNHLSKNVSPNTVKMVVGLVSTLAAIIGLGLGLVISYLR